MQRWWVSLGLAVAVGGGLMGCDDGGDGGGDGATAGATGGTTGTANGTSGTGATGDSNTTGTGATGDNTGATGDSSTTGTTGTSTTGTTGSDAGATTTGGAGACTNAADMGVIDGAVLGVAQLGCEGAACSGMSLLDPTDKEAIRECAMSDAPTLSQLSAECLECFVEITACVPATCVSVPGILDGTGECGGGMLALPNTDFNACTMEQDADTAECQACQEPCRTAFVECSGLTM